MLKAMIEKIVELSAPKTYEIEGKTFSSKKLELHEAPRYSPKCLGVTGLDSICKLVRHEAEKVGRKLFVQIESYSKVTVFSTYGDRFERYFMYECKADTPQVTMGRFMTYENAVIELRSLYIPNDDHKYLLGLLGSITNESKVSSIDNGITTKVEAKQGIALNTMVEVKPRVSLRPFRTFIEVEQPESDFLLRIDQSGNIGMFPADGGVWKLEATRNIAAYFERELEDLIGKERIVVIR